MIYYAVAYMKNGDIHLRPYNTKEEAQECLSKFKDSEFSDDYDILKIVKKDNDSAWFKSVNGYWI